jgi:hypothetical protein
MSRLAAMFQYRTKLVMLMKRSEGTHTRTVTKYCGISYHPSLQWRSTLPMTSSKPARRPAVSAFHLSHSEAWPDDIVELSGLLNTELTLILDRVC